MLNSMKQGLDKCWTAVRSACNLKLNKEKCRFCISEVCYVRHVLSSDGIKPDLQKVEAKNVMSTPANHEDWQRFLGAITYLSKFIPNMSQKSAHLCQPLQKDSEWSWEKAKETIKGLKTAISSAPVLKFFNSKEPETLWMQVPEVCYSPEQPPCS